MKNKTERTALKKKLLNDQVYVFLRICRLIDFFMVWMETYDIVKKQSELLKCVFIDLWSALCFFNSNVFTAGRLPAERSKTQSIAGPQQLTALTVTLCFKLCLFWHLHRNGTASWTCCFSTLPAVRPRAGPTLFSALGKKGPQYLCPQGIFILWMWGLQAKEFNILIDKKKRRYFLWTC